MGVAVNGSGRVFVTDSYRNVAEVFDNTGVHLTTISDNANPMNNPIGIAVNGAGIVFIASINTGKIEVYSITE
jgi:hypothetical protein